MKTCSRVNPVRCSVVSAEIFTDTVTSEDTVIFEHAMCSQSKTGKWIQLDLKVSCEIHFCYSELDQCTSDLYDRHVCPYKYLCLPSVNYVNLLSVLRSSLVEQGSVSGIAIVYISHDIF